MHLDLLFQILGPEKHMQEVSKEWYSFFSFEHLEYIKSNHVKHIAEKRISFQDENYLFPLAFVHLPSRQQFQRLDSMSNIVPPKKLNVF